MSEKAVAAVAVLSMALLTLGCGAQADEIEELQADNVTAEEKPVRYMFVQNAQSGTLVPAAGMDNLYALTLVGVAPQTIAFSDRPERVVVQAPMQKFLDGMCFSPENGPNAALEILDANEEEDVAVVELFDPEYDALNQTLRYNVSIIEQRDLSYASFNERADKALPETFGPAALFIDDCRDASVDCCRDIFCYTYNGCDSISTGCCWYPGEFKCHACDSTRHYVEECRKKFGSDCGEYINDECFY
jgi:hypothetical protein